MALTKAHIIDAIHKQLDLPKKRSTDLIENLIEIIKRNLEAGDDVLISGFGKFSVNCKNNRKGRNPATGEDMILPARKVVTFKCSHLLREKINSKG